ncbi:MAG: ATP-binding cassette domain-containing protein [Planctomycetia bacterium]|nr:ATP-binding cassette domain-containing protein [Planctomycetia bacterium]
MEFVCPYCQNGLSDDHVRCSHCGNMFHSNEWPEEAYSSNGMTSELTLKFGDISWQPQTDNFIIGRKVGSYDMRLDHPSVSGEHVRVSKVSNFWRVEKISNHSLWWNGKEEDTVVLSHGGRLTLGICLLNVDFSYHPESPRCEKNGTPCTQGSFSLRRSRNVKIGSDPSQCGIVISGIAPVHAILYQRGDSKEWWIVDCNTDCGTFLNHQQIRNYQLCQGDTIFIAGVPVQFSNEELQINTLSVDGLALSVSDLSVSIDNRIILDRIHFAINPGEFIGILGPSGCGKSSLIQRLIGLGGYSEGQICVNNIPVHSVRDRFFCQTAYLPQQVAIHENLTLRQECKTFCLLHSKSAYQEVQNIQSALTLVGLEHEMDKRLGDLSGGQKRRAGIALELLRSPFLFLLDEPTSGLDPATESDIMQYLRRIANQGKTVVCSTHLMENFDMFDKILLLSKGRVVFFGKPKELLRYFDVHRPLEVFKMLGSGSSQEQTATAIELAQRFESSVYSPNVRPYFLEPKNLPMPCKVPVVREISGYVRRSIYELFSFVNSKAPLQSFFLSTFFVWFVLQPLLIAFAIKLACAVKFYGLDSDAKLLFFLALLSMFWLGMTTSIREFVSERVPVRCLERLRQVSFGSYLLAKLITTSGVCLLQTAFFSLLFFGVPCFQVSGLESFDKPEVICWSPELSMILFFTCLMGSWLALAVSALARNESFAVGILPLILIPILLFSHPVIDHESTFDKNFKEAEADMSKLGKYCKPAILLEWMSPCHQPLVLMYHKNLQSKNRQSEMETPQRYKGSNDTSVKDASVSMFFNTFLWLFFSLMAMMVFQSHNEQSWEGR